MKNIIEILDRVNYGVNSTIVYKTDAREAWQPAYQTMRQGTGDCEDYAILKAWILANKEGVPASQMRIAVVNGRTNKTAHAILLVDGEYMKGFFRKRPAPCQWVLDNTTPSIYRFDQTRYKIKRIESVVTWIKGEGA